MGLSIEYDLDNGKGGTGPKKVENHCLKWIIKTTKIIHVAAKLNVLAHPVWSG